MFISSRAARSLFAQSWPSSGAVARAVPVPLGGASATKLGSTGGIWTTERCNCGRCPPDVVNCRTGGPMTGGSSLGMQQKRGYHEVVIDHFNQPRNVGKLDSKKSTVGSALVGKASCGDVIKLQIEVADDGKTIKDAKFKTFGCGSAIASSSIATEMIIGQNLDEAEKLKNTDISSFLNLPPIKVHCSVLAEEAIKLAIDDYKKKQAASASASA